MGDKIDLLNKKPPIPVHLPKRKTLNKDCDDCDLPTAEPNYQNPYLYDY